MDGLSLRSCSFGTLRLAFSKQHAKVLRESARRSYGLIRMGYEGGEANLRSKISVSIMVGFNCTNTNHCQHLRKAHADPW